MKYIGTKKLETNRLILRRLTVDDATLAFNNWCNSEIVSRYVTWTKHESVDETKSLFEEWEKSYEDLSTYKWIVELKSTKELIGTIDVASKKFLEYGTCCIGYCYGEKYWNKGYATEALTRVIKFLFEECDAEVIYADHMSNNMASGMVMMKSGMTYEGFQRGRILDGLNRRNDLLSYSITKEEYFKKNTVKKMAKKELIELIDSLKIDPNEFYLLSSSALVMRNLFFGASDLDIAVTKKGLNQLKSNYNLVQKENGWYKVNDKVECMLDSKESWKIERVDKYNLESLEKYYEFLKNSAREKDRIKKIIVEKELEKRKNMEYLELYDEDKNLANEKTLRYKGMKPIDGRYIGIVLLFIENAEGKFLIQKTSKEKENIFATTGGLVKQGNSFDEQVLEEAKEELNLDLEIRELKHVYTEKQKNTFVHTYYLKKDIDIEKLSLQKEEVEYVKWLSVNEINELINQESFRKGNIIPFKYIVENNENIK